MMRKKVNYTNVTPIPSFIPRQLAIDILHSHGEIIELNPLVTGFTGIKAPRDAPADEFYATWYEISQRIQYVPGVGKMGSGKIKFKGCFHDMPWGLQTHIYAPAGVDLRNKWQICGSQPGEPPETRELGIEAPLEGLYLREDIEIKCNMTMVSFVKKETKAASKVLVERLIKKAELLDSGVLHAMMENGRLKTINPNDRSDRPQSPSKGPLSPKMSYYMPQSPSRSSTFPHVPQTQNNVVMELPGDYYHPEQSLPPPLQPDNNRLSVGPSPNPSDARWSHASNDYQSSTSSRPSSYTSDGFRSPGLEQKGFAAELPTMEETREEDESAQKRLEAGYPAERHPAERHPVERHPAERHPAEQTYKYNPQDYAHAQHPAQFQPPPRQNSDLPKYSQFNPYGR